jgi:polysaccharide biosynthesis/export protein
MVLPRAGLGGSGLVRQANGAVSARLRPFALVVPVLLGALALSGCGKSLAGPNMAVGDAAYQNFAATHGETTAFDYRIGPLDKVDITVFEETDISVKGAVVDASGDVSMPLIGRIPAAGLKPTELADHIAARLQEKFYVNPQVTVALASSVAQKITVEGEVTEPGIYQLTGPTTLVDTIALAKGETDNAKTRQVAIIRYIDGKRTGAVFNLEAIRRGDAPDPEVLPKDRVIVGHSNGKQTWHDLLKAAPLLNVFAQF